MTPFRKSGHIDYNCMDVMVCKLHLRIPDQNYISMHDIEKSKINFHSIINSISKFSFCALLMQQLNQYHVKP